ncbi:sigma-54-dependent transcriptional regulator [Polycladidibacter stylochi]|uniref:sigma-54-dependent transcriptional regulator n=1 Tax=Polycladidibacter stylochi TaxID=1807766 RepID=UPI0008377B84|nr:sigma-54 dependent transcriptional regulator [Pseudovibrio stylochi]
MSQRILIVDDDPVQRRLLDQALKQFGYNTLLAVNGAEALHEVRRASHDIDLIILDIVMPEIDGIEFLTKLRAEKTTIPVIVQTAHGGIDRVVEAMRAGAQDFFVKPVSSERLRISIRNLLNYSALQGELTRLHQKNNGTLTFKSLVTRSEAMERVLRLGERAAKSTIPILIEGESGVGKELIARAIQGSSDRKNKPFITVNCGAIPDHLVESILFGHEKGAFTGAHEKHSGKFQEANGGTLFLDEVGELSLDIQVKLLRAIQEGEVEPVGARKPIQCDFRLISATNRRLLDQVKEGNFREDLYYRLNVYPIWVPPLKDRLEDIPELLRTFVARFAAEENKLYISGATSETFELLKSYDWPGNIRQFENAVFRAVILSDGPQLLPNDFPQVQQALENNSDSIKPESFHAPNEKAEVNSRYLKSTPPQEMQVANIQPSTLVEDETPLFGFLRILNGEGHIRSITEVEKELIQTALDHYAFKMSLVAKRLGIGRSTLYRKIKDYKIETKNSINANE